MGRLATLFAPERIAVVGASDEEGSVGRAITENLLDDFEGEVIAVNPNRESVLGLTCHDSLVDATEADGEAGLDLAVVAVPPGAVLDVVREAGETGVGSVVVVTAGFGETGSEGAARERELREIADEHDLDVVGPNSLGVLGTAVGMNATFAPENATPGSISFMSQSGAFVTAVLDESDFVAEWGDDPGTDVVLGYLEGIADGREFVRTAREVTRQTPVVLVKSGRTEASASAAASHTRAIAGSDRAYEAGLDRAGVLRVESVEDLFSA